MTKRSRCPARYSRTLLAPCCARPSQKSAIRPFTCRRRCLSVFTVSSLRTEPFLNVHSSRTRLRATSVAMMPVAEMLFHDPVDRMMGVSPFLPHVLRTVGRSEYPDSSRKQKVTRRSAPFFLDESEIGRAHV